MKKVFCVSLLALMLVCLLCASALAQTTGIAMDGKVYTFTGGEGTYQADGKTFIIGVESVVVQEPGLPDRVLELHKTEGTEIMRDGHPAAYATVGGARGVVGVVGSRECASGCPPGRECPHCRAQA